MTTSPSLLVRLENNFIILYKTGNLAINARRIYFSIQGIARHD